MISDFFTKIPFELSGSLLNQLLNIMNRVVDIDPEFSELGVEFLEGLVTACARGHELSGSGCFIRSIRDPAWALN